MGTRNKIPLDVKDPQDKYGDTFMQDLGSARSNDNLTNQDPGSPGSSDILSIWDPRYQGFHDNVFAIGSEITKIPRENENIGSNILQCAGSWILGTQDPGSFGIFAYSLFLSEWITAILKVASESLLKSSEYVAWTERRLNLYPKLLYLRLMHLCLDWCLYVLERDGWDRNIWSESDAFVFERFSLICGWYNFFLAPAPEYLDRLPLLEPWAA